MKQCIGAIIGQFEPLRQISHYEIVKKGDEYVSKLIFYSEGENYYDEFLFVPSSRVSDYRVDLDAYYTKDFISFDMWVSSKGDDWVFKQSCVEELSDLFGFDFAHYNNHISGKSIVLSDLKVSNKNLSDEEKLLALQRPVEFFFFRNVWNAWEIGFKNTVRVYDDLKLIID